MAKIVKKLTDLIGKTPLLELGNYSASKELRTAIIAKLEYFNPASSIKDRIAKAMIEDAENSGILNSTSELIEATSGNTGIGLAFVAAAKGYKLTLTMPETMSMERRKLLSALGANLVLTPGAEGMKGAVAKAEELLKKNPNAVALKQFENKANPKIHQQTTAEEIWHDSNGKVDIIVAGVGTGGTLSGVGERLKNLNPQIKIIAVEPSDSAVLSGGQAGPHKIQGIGAGFIPGNYNSIVVDEILKVSNDQAIHTSRELARTEGLLVGFSSGAAIFAATQIAKREENIGKNIIAILPDSGERYLSTILYDSEAYPL